MKSWILLRVASVLTLIFCAGHTYGALGSSSRDPEQAAVFMAMQASRSRSWEPDARTGSSTAGSAYFSA